MDYKNKYNEALERARELSKTTTGANYEYIFPELKEDEDELTWLKNYISEEAYYLSMDIRDNEDSIKLQKLKKSLAWLEKQGEQKPTDKIHLGKEYKCIASPRYSTFMRGKIYKPEDKFLCSLMNFCSDCFEPIEDSEQSDFTSNANKVEPKFKVGDWITDGNITIQIEAIKNNCYLYCGDCALYSIKTADKVYHLWTIADAKDGDVLISYMNKPFIYNRCIDENLVGTYCGLNLDGEFYTYGIYGRKPIWSVNEGITPATKEQRNMLFSKMKEAGYKWDSEKKQLITAFKPKFRIGDTIKKKSTGDIVTISMVDLKNGEYRLSNTGFIPFNYEHLWELAEQKPTDIDNKSESESEFKVGEWVVSPNGVYWHIDKISNNRYEVTSNTGVSTDWNLHTKFYHRFTIQDAVDGDIIYAKSKFSNFSYIRIFFKTENGNSWDYCNVFSEDLERWVFDNDEGFLRLNRFDFYPASKEQRDLLFVKMREAGYEWDSKQKKLKQLKKK